MALPVRRRESVRRSTQRFEPFIELEDLQERMQQLIENAWSGGGDGEGDRRPWIPQVDIEESDDAWIIEAEVPGAERDDVDVELRDAELVISGEIKERERKGILRRRTRRTGAFEFRVVLPGQPDPDAVDANLEHGVITVRVPKAEQARARQIEVHSKAS
jgi:HSP20 family protein